MLNERKYCKIPPADETSNILTETILLKAVNLTEGKLITTKELIKNQEISCNIAEKAIFLSITDQGLILTGESLDSMRTILSRICDKIPSTDNKNLLLRRMISKLEEVSSNTGNFSLIVQKYFNTINNQSSSGRNYLDKGVLSYNPTFKRYDFSEWNSIATALEKLTIVNTVILKLLVISITKILLRVEELIALIKSKIEKLIIYSKESLAKRKGPGCNIKHIKDFIPFSILSHSRRSILLHIKKITPYPYYLLN